MPDANFGVDEQLLLQLLYIYLKVQVTTPIKNHNLHLCQKAKLLIGSNTRMKFEVMYYYF